MKPNGKETKQTITENNEILFLFFMGYLTRIKRNRLNHWTWVHTFCTLHSLDHVIFKKCHSLLCSFSNYFKARKLQKIQQCKWMRESPTFCSFLGNRKIQIYVNAANIFPFKITQFVFLSANFEIILWRLWLTRGERGYFVVFVYRQKMFIWCMPHVAWTVKPLPFTSQAAGNRNNRKNVFSHAQWYCHLYFFKRRWLNVSWHLMIHS